MTLDRYFARVFLPIYIMVSDLKSKIKIIEDWPRPGIDCYDISPLLADSVAFSEMIKKMAEPYRGQPIDIIVGVEARGFVIASALAYELGAGVAMVRKKGKLPPPTDKEEYSYEYASNVIEIGTDYLYEDKKVVIVDDILATGGTMSAVEKLIKRNGIDILGISFVVEMELMSGRDRLRHDNIQSLVKYN